MSKYTEFQRTILEICDPLLEGVRWCFKDLQGRHENEILVAYAGPDLSCVDGGSSLSFSDSPLKQQASKSPETMKFSTFFTATFIAAACLFQSITAEDQASVHLRVHNVEQSDNGAICYKACPSGQYCPRGETECRAPSNNQCFNPATSLFISACDPGFKCDNGKCVYA